MVRLFRATELPPDVPGLIITDGLDTAVLINASLADERGAAWAGEVANTLLAHHDTEKAPLIAVG